MTRRTVIRVLNSVTHTSAPLNQFALYRARHFPEERGVIVSLAPPARDIIDYCAAQTLAGGLELHHGGGRASVFLRVLRKLITEARAQGPVLLHLHHPAAGSLVQLLKLPLAARPVLYTVHNAFHTPKNRVLTRLNFLLADHITFVGNASYNAFPQVLLRLKPATSVIPNGVDLDRVDRVLAELGQGERADTEEGAKGAPPEALKLITVGRMVEAKYQEFLLEVIAQLPPHVSLTVVGDGAKAPELRARAHTLGVAERVDFTGLIPRDEVFRRMRGADVFVSSSLWEGLPVAVLEAMASSLPAVLSDIAPHRELAEQAPRLVVAPLTVAPWVAALTALARTPRAARLELGRENRRAVEAHFSLATMQRSYTEVYEQLLRSVAVR
jgi:glycosyltransferase involved in cell wall biosynthesis